MAIKQLQKKVGVMADGIFGPKTLRAAAVYFNFNKHEASHFFGQCAHESQGFTRFEENLNYSAGGLLKTFRKYFDKLYIDARDYAYNPEKIANLVYANRMGNGPESSGDGYKYRGFGAIMTTGKDNVVRLASYLGNPAIVENPKLIATEYAFESALFFFRSNNLFELCGNSVSQSTIAKVTKRVNGGYNGLDDRVKYTLKYYRWLSQ